MRLDQTLTDGQSQSRAHRVSGRMLPLLDTVKLIEDSLYISGRDAGTAIGHANFDLLPFALCAYGNGGARRRVAYSVLDQIGQDLVDLQIVQVDHQQVIRWQVGTHVSTMQEWIQPP